MYIDYDYMNHLYYMYRDISIFISFSLSFLFINNHTALCIFIIIIIIRTDRNRPLWAGCKIWRGVVGSEAARGSV